METKWRRVALSLITAGLFLACSIVGNLASHQASGLQTIWPGNALILGLLVARVHDRADGLAIGLGGGITSIAFHLWTGDGLAIALIFSLANLVEAGIAYALLRRAHRVTDMFDRVGDVVAVMLACGAACCVSALIGAITLSAIHHIGLVEGWLNWFGVAYLSHLLLAPMVIICAQLTDRRRLRTLATHSPAEIVLILSATAASAILVFFWTRLPLLFLMTPIVLVATFRMRAFGAAASVAIVTVVTVYATAHGHGPIAAHAHGPVQRTIILQVFLAMCFLTALPIAAVLTQADARNEEMRLLADRFRAVVENIGDVIFRIDPLGNWMYLNPAWEAVTGHATIETTGRPWTDLVDEADREELIDRLAPVLTGEERMLRRTVRFNTTGGPRWMEIFVQTLADGEGRPAGATGTLRDIDDRKRLEEHVMTAKRRAEKQAREATLLASTDELTGIANRRAFMQQLDRELAGSVEFGWPLAVAMFDVDHFKSVNDRHGHAVGDRVLQLIARRAGLSVRGGDLVGRLGGEEFGILMPGATIEDAMAVAERLREMVETPREDQSGLPAVTVSIGVAEREGIADPRALLAAADAALYQAKASGRNRVRIAA